MSYKPQARPGMLRVFNLDLVVYYLIVEGRRDGPSVMPFTPLHTRFQAANVQANAFSFQKIGR